MSEVTAVPLRPVSRAGVVTLSLGIALFVAIGVGAAWATTQGAVMTALPAGQFMLANGSRSGVKTTPSGLEYEVLKAGSGPTPGAGDVAQIEYKGKLTNGTEFDASKSGPVALPLSQVIPGFAEALMLIPRGGHYRVWIPPELAYGDHEAGPIPPNSVLVFDITLHDFAPMPQQPTMPAGMDQPPQGQQ